MTFYYRCSECDLDLVLGRSSQLLDPDEEVSINVLLFCLQCLASHVIKHVKSEEYYPDELWLNDEGNWQMILIPENCDFTNIEGHTNLKELRCGKCETVGLLSNHLPQNGVCPNCKKGTVEVYLAVS